MRTLIFVLLCSVISTGGMADVKLQRIGGTLFHPWGLSLLNNTEALVTERRGKLFRINLTTGERSEISNVPKAFTERQGGLLDKTGRILLLQSAHLKRCRNCGEQSRARRQCFSSARRYFYRQ